MLHKILQGKVSQTVTMSFIEIDFDKNLVLSVTSSDKGTIDCQPLRGLLGIQSSTEILTTLI